MGKTSSIKGVLFDLDGTLVDTEALILASFRYATKTVLGRDIPDEELRAKIGQPLTVQMWDWADGSQEVHDKLFNTYLEHNDRVHSQLIRSFPDTIPSLDALRAAGLPLGIVTSKRSENAARAMKSTGIDGYFEFVVAPDTFPAHKPDPEPVLHGCELLGVQHEECIYIGDSPYDMQAGRGTGCVTVAALWGMFGRDDLLAEHPDYAISSLAELVPIAVGK
jgi:pyrophosphatase PpaX